MEKVSAGSPPRSSGEGPAACTGAERSVTSAPTSKGARISRLVFVRRRRPIDWLNSLIIGAVLNLEFIVYFLSLHVGLALPYQSLARRFVLYRILATADRRPAPANGPQDNSDHKAVVLRERGYLRREQESSR